MRRATLCWLSTLLASASGLAFGGGAALGRPAVSHRHTLHPALPRHVAPSAIATEAALPVGTPIPYGDLTVGVVRETDALEDRVAQTPQSVASLVKAGFNVVVEKGAGAHALFTDDMYTAEGATIAESAAAAWKSDIVIKLNPPSSAELKQLGSRTLVSLLNPQKNDDLLNQLQSQGATCFALDCIPRMLSRGQAFDVLSSQTNIIGYRAVVEAQHGASHDARATAKATRRSVECAPLAAWRGPRWRGPRWRGLARAAWLVLSLAPRPPFPSLPLPLPSARPPPSLSPPLPSLLSAFVASLQ